MYLQVTDGPAPAQGPVSLPPLCEPAPAPPRAPASVLGLGKKEGRPPLPPSPPPRPNKTHIR